MNIICVLMYLYLFLKPYYLFKSGGIQISDIFLIVAFIFMLLTKNNKKVIKDIVNHNIQMLFFLVFVIIINVLYYIVFLNSKFLISTIYFVFIFIAILLFEYILENNNVVFLEKIDRIFKVNIIIQFFIAILGIGRYYDSSRYMGTFNDPNQFGFYILLSLFFLFFYAVSKKKSFVLYYLLCLYLIIRSASTGMLLSFAIFTILYIVYYLKSKNFKMVIRNFPIYLIIIATIILVLLIIINSNPRIKEKIDNVQYISFVMNRIFDKFDRMEATTDTNTMSIFEERGYDKLFNYPQYLLFGAGEGNYSRFMDNSVVGEIHATLPSILFYYGLLPTIILVKWILNNIKNIDKKYFIVFIALLIESFTLLNQRQVLFWIIILVAKYYDKLEKEK